MPKALIEFHHTCLHRGFQHLFEKRLGWELYRPEGCEWYEKGYYHHPIPEEALGNLTPYGQFDPARHRNVLGAVQDGVMWKNCSQDGMIYRWMRLEQLHEIDLIVCTSYRNEHNFWKLKQDFGLKCPILRYTGNGGEPVDLGKFDIFIPALLSHYEEYVKTGRKPGILFHPEFDLDLYSYTPLPKWEKPILRTFLNFIWHHREAGSPWEVWDRYCGYASEVGALTLMHGLGTPPPGVDVDLDVIIDISFDKMGLQHLKDRNKWPDLRFNRGEPPNHTVISDLMKFSNMVVHSKHSPPEGYGFCIHEFAACGRPPIVPQHYHNLSARAFLQDRETCLYITGDNETDKANFKWAMQPENNQRMSETLYQRFKETVNFEAEAQAIAKLL